MAWSNDLGQRAPQRGRRWAIASLGAITIGLVIGGSVLESIERHQEALERGRLQAANLARALAHDAERSIAESSQVLATLAGSLPRNSDLAEADERAMHEMLRDRLRLVPQVKAAFVVDGRGRAVVTSLYFPERRIDLSDRAYFSVHRDDRARGLHVGDVIKSRTTGDWVITLSRRLEGDGRDFRGVIVGGLDAQFFAEFYKAFDIGRAGRIELISSAGDILARSPFDESALGRKTRAEARIRALLAGSPSAILADEADRDGVRRVLAVHKAENAPVAVVVGLARDDILAVWRVQSMEELVTTLLTVAVVLLLTILVLRHIGRLGRSEARLREQGALLHSVFEGIGDGVAVMDNDGRYIAVNPAAERILGKTNAELAGQRPDKTMLFVPDGTAPVPPEQLPLARLARGETGDAEYLLRRTDGGEPVRVAVTVRQLRDQDGAAQGAVALLRDDTQRRDLEDRLQRSQRLEALGKLTGGVAHDFNNLLLVIMGGTEALTNALANRPDLRRHAEMAMNAAERAAELTRQLLAFGRRQTLQPSDVAVTQLVERMTTMLERILGSNIGIELKLDPATGNARADAAQLEVAIVNLAANARDAMPSGGRLSIETRPAVLDAAYAAANPDAEPGDYVAIAVSDTGAGMPPEVVDRALEPFYTTKPFGAGTGLGLSSVYGFVKQSGGHMKLHSAVGHGTTVTLYLPRAGATAAPAARPDIAPAQRGRGETVLVVEDDAAVRAFAADKMRAFGYRVIEAGDARSALEIVRSGAKPDLLFTDVVMPGGMNGAELAAAATAMQPGLKALLTSGYSEVALAGSETGGPQPALLNKPYRAAELAAAIRAALDGPPRV